MTDTTNSEAEGQEVQTPSEEPVTHETAMGEAYERAMAEREAAEQGPPRDEHGRFVSAKEEPAEGEEPKDAEAEAGEDAEPEQPEEAEAEDTGEQEPPAHLPQALKDAWREMPAAAREAVAKHQQDIDRKFSQQGRQLQAVQPISERLNKAIEQYPQFKDMTPEQLADGALQLAAVQRDLEKDPVNTVMRIAEEFGVAEHLRSHFNGQQPSDQSNYIAELKSEIRNLKSAVEQGQGSIDDRISAAISERETASVVERFASEQPYWSDVEPYLPRFVEIAKEQQPDAAPADTLKAAYDMAVHAIPEVRAKAGATNKAAPKHDPERSDKAKRATSVNLKSSASGKERAMTQEEAMAAAYERAVQD